MRTVALTLATLVVAGACSDTPTAPTVPVGTASDPIIRHATAPSIAGADRILLDTRTSLQQASSLQQAWAIFPGNDHSRERPVAGATGWRFAQNFDGAGTRALRADWDGPGRCSEANVRVISYLNRSGAPTPRRLAVQWTNRLGRHAADADANGGVDSFVPANASCAGASRHVMRVLRDDAQGGAAAGVNLLWLGNPARLHIEQSAIGRVAGNQGWEFLPAQAVGRAVTYLLEADAESAAGARDGVLRLWIDGRLFYEGTALALNPTAFHRFEFPGWYGSPAQDQAEYFYDVMAWEPGVPVARVAVTPATASVVAGDTVRLDVATFDARGNALTGRVVAWSSSDTTIAIVATSGLVTARRAGTATITAAAEGQAGTATITVLPPPVARVAVSPAVDTVEVGTTVQLAAVAYDAKNVALADRSISWSSADTTIARVSTTGLVTALKAGSVAVTATSDGKSGSAAILVTPSATVPPPTTTPTTGTLGCANPQPGWIWCDDFEQNRLASYFEYQNAGGNFARIAGTGVNGSTGMRAHWNQGNVGVGSLKLAFGRTPDSYMRPVDAGTANYREVYWRVYVYNSSNWRPNGNDKLSRGIVFAGSNWSEAAIGHVWGGSSATAQNHLLLDPASGTDQAGTLRTTRYNDFANLRWLGPATSTTPIFASQNVGKWHCVETRMRLNDAGQANGVFEMWIDGALEARRTGLNWLGAYAAYGINSIFLENYINNGALGAQDRVLDEFVVSTQPIGCGGSTGGTVPTPAPAPTVASVTVTLNSPQLDPGQLTQAVARAYDANGTLLTDRAVSWGSNNTSVARVDAFGMVTAVGSGTTTIVASVEGRTGSASITVTAPAPTPTPTPTPTPVGVPAPDGNDRLIMDLRQSLQQAGTLEQAWALFPGNDHTGARTTRNTSTGWSFTTNFDGQGTRALRADWRAYSAGDQRVVIITKLPAPKPRDLCVQYKTYTGRHAADPDGNGEVGAFPVYPNGMSAKRLLFLRDLPDLGGTARIDYTWTRSDPSTARVQINDMNWARGANTSVWTVLSSLGKAYTQTICVKASSAEGAADGTYRMWVDGTLILDVTADLRPFGFDRWQFPDTQHNITIPASEYFWDVVVWSPVP